MNRLHKILNASFTMNLGCFGFTVFIVAILGISTGIALLLIKYL